MTGPSVLSLFSGIGGLDLGLEAAGFEIVGSVEHAEAARGSLRLNRAWPMLSPHDVEEVATGPLPFDEVDIIAGAPPCQPFSKAAEWHPSSRVGLDDDRGLLIFSVLELVDRLRPKVVVLENVAGFVRGRTSVLPILRESLDTLQSRTGHRYELDFRVLDAHHFGVAQSRRRAIVVLSRVGRLEWPEPLNESERPVAWDAIGGLPEPTDLTSSGKWAGLLPSIPEGHNYQWHTPRGGGLPIFGYRTRYWQFLLKLAKDRPAWTLAASPGPSTGPFHWNSRPLTTAEMLRLQGFPPEWQLSGGRRTEVHQIGNATPPPLAEAVGRSLARLLGRQVRGAPEFRLTRSGLIPDAEVRGDVPARYLDLVDFDIPDHPGAGRGPAPRLV